MSEKLKPCPFCGSEAKIGNDFGRVSAECTECYVSIRSLEPCATSPKEVTKAWNTRTDSEELQRLKAEIKGIKDIIQIFAETYHSMADTGSLYVVNQICSEIENWESKK